MGKRGHKKRIPPTALDHTPPQHTPPLRCSDGIVEKTTPPRKPIPGDSQEADPREVHKEPSGCATQFPLHGVDGTTPTRPATDLREVTAYVHRLKMQLQCRTKANEVSERHVHHQLAVVWQFDASGNEQHSVETRRSHTGPAPRDARAHARYEKAAAELARVKEWAAHQAAMHAQKRRELDAALASVHAERVALDEHIATGAQKLDVLQSRLREETRMRCNLLAQETHALQLLREEEDRLALTCGMYQRQKERAHATLLREYNLREHRVRECEERTALIEDGLRALEAWEQERREMMDRQWSVYLFSYVRHMEHVQRIHTLWVSSPT